MLRLASVFLFLLAVPLWTTPALQHRTGDVLVLDAANFNDVISKQSFIVVDFYAPWCGHCKRLAPEYEKAAALLKTHKPSIVLAKVDANEQANKALASKYGVSGYPTLKIFENNGGIVRDYYGPRDADGIISYLKREAGPSLEKIVSLDQGETLANEVDIFLFMDSTNEGAEEIKAIFNELASEYKGKGLRFITADTENGQKPLQHFEVKKEKLPSILVQGKDEAVYVLEKAEAGKVSSWLKDYLDGKLSPLQKLEPTQGKNEKLIQEVVADTFEALVLKSLENGHVFVEALLVVVIVFLLLQKSYQPEKRPLTTQEIDQLCDEWSPEPLHPPITAEMEVETPLLESAAGPRAIVNGEEVINMSTANYLGLMGDKRIVEACTTTLEKYGVGSCGPRGFYGTIDVHLDCELKISEFLGTRDSILYSYGLATAASTIPAFCKRGDLILADEAVNWGLQNGMYLSRSTVKLFKHNDMSSLESLLVEVDKEDHRNRKALNRRFIIVEAIYQNSGQMAPLLDLIRLKEKYRFRLLMDESNSIGVLGNKGRGLTEHFKVPIEKVDIITAAMGHALASAGGFCTGSTKVVDHQRLSGAGYCFSASLPPYVASASIAAISVLQKSPNLLSKLQGNITFFRKALSDVPGLVITSHPMSPIIFMHLKKTCGSFKEDSRVLQKISEQMVSKESVLVSVTTRSVLDKCKLPAALRLAVSAGHTEVDLSAAAAALRKVAASILESDCNGRFEIIR
eukprot:c24875_g1_i1 orf=202-2427(+)